MTLRTKMHSRFILAALAVAVPVTALAAPLTWDDCLKLTRENNPSLKAATAAYEQASALKSSAFGNYFPQISVNVGGTHSFTEVSGVATSTDSFNATANLTQNLFNGFADQGRYEQAKENERSALHALQAAKAAASEQLKTAFASLQYAHDYLHLSEEIIKRREYNLQLVQLRFEGGRENKGSLLLSKAYLSEAKYNHLQADSARQEAEVSMRNVLGLEELKISEANGAVPLSLPPAKVDFKALAAETPEVQQAIASEAQSRAGITIARAGLLPTLAFNAAAGKQDSVFYPQGDRWSIGLGLTIPLFNGGHDYYALRAAHASLNNSISNRRVVETQAILKLTQAYDAYVQAVEKAKVDLAYLEAALVRAEIARHKYNNGLQTFEEWDLVENDLINRQRNALISQRDRVAAEANWEFAQGRGALP